MANEERYYHDLEIAKLRSHEKHMAYIYGLRWGALALSGFTILIGAVMIFLGLQGSFDWAVEAPSSVGAKLTNASPGIIFATVGMLIGLLAVNQKPVDYDIGGGESFSTIGDRRRSSLSSIVASRLHIR